MFSIFRKFFLKKNIYSLDNNDQAYPVIKRSYHFLITFRQATFDVKSFNKLTWYTSSYECDL